MKTEWDVNTPLTVALCNNVPGKLKNQTDMTPLLSQPEQSCLFPFLSPLRTLSFEVSIVLSALVSDLDCMV